MDHLMAKIPLTHNNGLPIIQPYRTQSLIKKICSGSSEAKEHSINVTWHQMPEMCDENSKGSLKMKVIL